MIYALALPFISAGLNRTWRGEGGAPKWAWLGFMTIMAWCLTFDPLFTLAWTLTLLGYAVPPNQALFSAVHGFLPMRKDSREWQWMQDCAYWIEARLPAQNTAHAFGMIYGAFRAIPMAPGIFMMAGYTQSLAPLMFGQAFLLLGAIYAMCGRVDRAERAVGFMLGCYLLVCAEVLV